MKILITTEFYLPLVCGVTTAVLNQRKALEDLGHEVRILTISDTKKSYFENSVYHIKNTIRQLYKDSYATLAFNDSLLKGIYDWKPDIVHAQCEFFTMFFAKKIAKKVNAPLILTSHTDFDSYGIHFMKNQHLWHYLTRTFVPKFIKKSDFIICPTNKNYEILKGYGVKNRMKIIPVGLDLGRLERSLSYQTRKEMRAEFGFTENDIVIISVCRLSEEKNVKESIEHFASLYKLRKNTRMLIVGDGTTKDDLVEQVARLQLDDVIKFSGGIEMAEVWKYYKLGDIFISSSLSEIQGLTYIEALASSLPIVCRKDNALSMSLIYGTNGYDFVDDKEFLTAIIPLVDDKKLRISMGNAALKSVRKYSIEQFGKNLVTIYKQTINYKKKKELFF